MFDLIRRIVIQTSSREDIPGLKYFQYMLTLLNYDFNQDQNSKRTSTSDRQVLTRKMHITKQLKFGVPGIRVKKKLQNL